jgi:hypothetical protein
MEADVTGINSADVFGSIKMYVEVTSTSDVSYKGDPGVSQNVSGAGSVKKAD